MQALNILLNLVGILAASSFVLIAVGDYVTSSVNTLIEKLIEPLNTPFSTKVLFCWSLVEDLYVELRTFLNKISIYSRPRLESKSARNKSVDHS